MSESETRTGVDTAEDDGHRLFVVSADRSEVETQEAYSIEWREPANKQSLADRIRDWF